MPFRVRKSVKIAPCVGNAHSTLKCSYSLKFAFLTSKFARFLKIMLIKREKC